MFSLFLEDTTVPKHRLCVYGGDRRDAIPPHQPTSSRVFISTYGSLAIAAPKNSVSAMMQHSIISQNFQLLCLDEVHHAAAPTYRELINRLKKHRVIGTTATLIRHELVSSLDRAANVNWVAHESRCFEWLGVVLFRATLRQACAEGILAHTNRVSIRCTFTSDFATAYDKASVAKQNIVAAHPEKIQVLHTICAMHAALGHIGVVFAQTLYAATTLKEILGRDWELLSGSSAHGENLDNIHTHAHNSKVVADFNEGKLAGVIATALAESAVDLNHPRFTFVVVANFHAGRASAVQRIGRLSRTTRVVRENGETDEELTQRQRLGRKSAYYYELPTADTEEVATVQARDSLFTAEGYEPAVMIESASSFLRYAQSMGVEMPIADREAQLALLRNALVYRKKAVVELDAKKRVRETKAPSRQLLSKHRAAAADAPVAVMRELAARRVVKARRSLAEASRLANSEFAEAMDGTQLDDEGREIFRLLEGGEEEQEEQGGTEKGEEASE